MAALIIFLFGGVCGWFAHQYRESIKRVADTVKEEFK